MLKLNVGFQFVNQLKPLKENIQNLEQETENMSLKNKALTTIFSIIFAMGFVSVVTLAKAKDVAPRLSCTNRSLLGYYGVKSSGFVNSRATPFNLVFIDRFDGNGNIIGVKGSTSTGGVIAQNVSDTGIYKVNSDCTVTITFNAFDTGNGIKYTNFGVLVDNGRKILYTATDSGANVSGTFEKVDY